MNKPSPIVKYALMGIVTLGMFQTKQLTQWVDGQIQELPVYGKLQQTAQPDEAAKKKPQANPDLVKSLVPIFIENPKNKSNLEGDVDPGKKLVDSVFVPPVDAKLDQRAPQLPEAAGKEKAVPLNELIHNMAFSLTLEATSKNAAILNGKTYAVGDNVIVDGVQVGKLVETGDTYAVVKTPLKSVKVYLTN